MNIRLAENFRAVFYAPFYATVALGFHREEGVDITLLDSPSPGAGINDLVAGRIDCVWGGPLRVIRELRSWRSAKSPARIRFAWSAKRARHSICATCGA